MFCTGHVDVIVSDMQRVKSRRVGSDGHYRLTTVRRLLVSSPTLGRFLAVRPVTEHHQLTCVISHDRIIYLLAQMNVSACTKTHK